MILPFKTIDGTAKEDKDYVAQNGELVFNNEETKATIYIEIINDDEYEKSEEFYVELGMPILKDGRQNKEEGVPDGRPVLGAQIGRGMGINSKILKGNIIDAKL